MFLISFLGLAVTTAWCAWLVKRGAPAWLTLVPYALAALVVISLGLGVRDLFEAQALSKPPGEGEPRQVALSIIMLYATYGAIGLIWLALGGFTAQVVRRG